MRTRLIRTLSLSAAAALLTLGLTACGGSDDDASSRDASATPSTSAPTKDAKDAEDAADAAEDAAKKVAAGDGSEFCAMIQESAAKLETGIDDLTDPTNLQASVKENVKMIQNIEVPAEIADDWAVYAAAYEEMAAAIADLDPNSATFQADMLTAMAPLTNGDLQTANMAIGTYAQEHCGI